MHVGLIACMLAMALLPLVGTGTVSAANDGDPIVLDQAVNPEASQIDTVDPNLIDDQEVPIEPADGAPVDVPEPVRNGAAVAIVKYACPDGFDAVDSDLDGLYANCGALGDVGFLVGDSNGGTTAINTDGSGGAYLDGLPAGQTTVTEQLPDGYATPRVFCSIDAEGVDGNLDEMSVDESTVSSNLDVDQTLTCQWFNIPYAGDNSGDNSIVIYKHVCQVGFDAYDADPDGLAAGCGEWQDGVTFDVTDGGPTNLSDATGPVDEGKVVFGGLDAGEYFITEEIPDGYGQPVVYCALAANEDGEPEDYAPMDLSADGQIFSVLASSQTLWCHWFNVPSDDPTVTIDKYECPQGFDADNASVADLSVSCAGVPMDGVDFTLTDSGNATQTGTTGDAGPGKVSWSGVAPGNVSITEDIPSGYGQPVVLCFLDDASWSPDGPQIDVQDGTIQVDLTGYHTLHCEWFNVPTDDVTITIVKYTCVPGYDLNAPGADPSVDCPNLTNGIGFELDGKGEHEQGVTGDGGEGTVTFDGLAWHPWEVSENVPAGTDYSFVLSCEGSSTQQIQGYPLLVGTVLGIDVAPGDHVTCYWYNVPEVPGGTVTIVKEYCQGTVFVSSDDCQIYEGGAGFSLTVWNGSDWVEVAQGTTDGSGYLSWYGLQAGTYQIDEIGGTWCYAVADHTDKNGYLVVGAGEETTVTVYNCGVNTKPKPPKKFPNTGVAPGAATAPTAHDAPVSPAGDPAPVRNGWPWFFDSRLTPPVGFATKPVSLRIASVGIDAKTETLEIVDGGLQDPTTADKVAWYKDTAKLGVPGNVVMAGHLNYWGIPEGVFFHLADVKPDAVIEVTGENGVVYRYR
ncbi:MAG TPA: sortase, partial [Thermomicrobiales bacterium]